MNNVSIIGRLTRDPDVRYTQSRIAVARFTVALDRGKDKEGNSRGADFPGVIAFGKTAELMERYVNKGDRVGIQGHLHTDKYKHKDGYTVYTTEIVVDRLYLLGGKAETAQPNQPNQPNGYDAAYQQQAEDYLRSTADMTEEDDDGELPF